MTRRSHVAGWRPSRCLRSWPPRSLAFPGGAAAAGRSRRLPEPLHEDRGWNEPGNLRLSDDAFRRDADRHRARCCGEPRSGCEARPRRRRAHRRSDPGGPWRGDECELSGNLLLNFTQQSLAAGLNVLRGVQPPAPVSDANAAERRDRGRNDCGRRVLRTCKVGGTGVPDGMPFFVQAQQGVHWSGSRRSRRFPPRIRRGRRHLARPRDRPKVVGPINPYAVSDIICLPG